MVFLIWTRCLSNSSRVQIKYENRILSPILGTSIYLLTNYVFIYLFDFGLLNSKRGKEVLTWKNVFETV